MYARVTNYKMKPDSILAATALMEQLKPQILAMPGIIRFINAHDDTGSGYVVSIVESRETAESSIEAVQAMWSNFSEFLEEPPTPNGYSVIADWAK